MAASATHTWRCGGRILARIEEGNRKREKKKIQKTKLITVTATAAVALKNERFSRSPEEGAGRATREKCYAYSLRYSWRFSTGQRRDRQGGVSQGRQSLS